MSQYCSFYLDGTQRFESLVKCYYYQSEGKLNTVYNRHILLRLTLPIHLALTIIFATNLHILRATASLLSGIFTLNQKKIESSSRDLLSTCIELIVLPIFGLIALIYPKMGIRVMGDFTACMHEEYIEIRQQDKCVDKIANFINGFIRGLFALPIGLVTSTIQVLTAPFIANPNEGKAGILVIFFSLLSPILGIVAGKFQSIDTMIHRIHCIETQHV